MAVLQEALLALVLTLLVRLEGGQAEVACAAPQTFMCSQEYCNKCFKGRCKPQEDCDNGKLVKDDTECGCCGNRCIRYIEEGKPCSLSPLGGIPEFECGPGLQCTPGVGMQFAECQPANTTCIVAQLEYNAARENGTLGVAQFQPVCDDYGFYSPRQCIPGSICYCVDEEGNRIHGEAPSMQKASDMNCACSRDFVKAKKAGQVRKHAHCLPNGNFDPLQCVGEICFCMDKDRHVYSVHVHISSVPALPCFDHTQHSAHYLRDCEYKLKLLQQELDEFYSEGVIMMGVDPPSCSPDGNYARVQHIQNQSYCSDPSGRQLENFLVERFTPASSTMNCNCARARYLLEDEVSVKPKCCTNGNYHPWQCRNGVCYCVDDFGQQMGLEVPLTAYQQLSCWASRPCPSSYAL